LQDGGAGGLAGEVLGGFFGLIEEVEAHAAAAAAGAFGGVDGIFGDDEDVEARERLGVRGEGAVGGGDEDAAQLVVDAAADLRDAGVEVAGGLVGAFDEFELGGDLGVGADHGIERGRCAPVREALHALGLRAVGDERGGARGLEQALGGEVIGVGEAGALAGEHADAAAHADALRGGLDDALVHGERGGGDGLEVEVGELAAGGEGFAEAALEQALGQAEVREEVALVVEGLGERRCGAAAIDLIVV
jgi:hypothetical protein